MLVVAPLTTDIKQCNRIVDMVMVYAGDWMLNFQQDVATVLDKGYKVLVYAGEMDFICNWWGNYQWTQAFEWSGHSEYASASNHTWQSGGKDAGITKSAKGLTFLKVFKAGRKPRAKRAPTLTSRKVETNRGIVLTPISLFSCTRTLFRHGA